MQKVILIFSFVIISLIGDNLKAQNFQSETDVLYYLDNKAFSNKSTGVTLSFSDMGSNMRINSRFLFQPEITVLSSYKAYCEYTVADDPSQKIRFVVNSSDNSIVEKGTGRAYFYEVSQNNFQQPQENTKKNNAVSIPKTVKYLTGDFTSLNDKLVGTYESKMNKGYILQITKVNSKKGSISLSYNGIKINASFRTTPWPMLNPDEKQKDFMFCNNETNVYIKGILGKNGTVTSLEVLVMGSNIKGHNGIVRFIRIK